MPDDLTTFSFICHPVSEVAVREANGNAVEGSLSAIR
jgi:hypothetical protein